MATWIPEQGGARVGEETSSLDAFSGNGADRPTQPVPKITEEMVAAARPARPAERAARLGLRRRLRMGGAPELAGTSPWQRSQAVWEAAGVDWVEHEADLSLLEGAARRGTVSPSPSPIPIPNPAGSGIASTSASTNPAAEPAVTGSADDAAAPDRHDATAAHATKAVGAGGAETETGPRPEAESAPKTESESEPGFTAEFESKPGNKPESEPEGGSEPEAGREHGDESISGERRADASSEPSEPSEPSEAPAETPPAAPPVIIGIPGGTLPAAPRRRRRTPLAAAVLTLVLVGGAGYLAVRGEGRPQETGPAAVRADRIFALDPAAAPAGRTHSLDAVAAADGTIVAVGSELGGPDRGQFFTSADGGRTWRLAEVRAKDGGEPPPGELPRWIAGGAGSWVALGGSASGGAVWTSKDGALWTRQPDTTAAVFGRDDQVTGLARTRSGFVAVGRSSDDKGAVWTSPDGRSWRRALADGLKLGAVTRFDRVAGSGDTLVVAGELTKTTTKTVTEKENGKTTKRKVSTTTRRVAYWRSADGGTTWSAVAIPHGQGSDGEIKALAAGPGGFYAVREGSRTTTVADPKAAKDAKEAKDAKNAKSAKPVKKTTRHGVVFRSADGSAWSVAGRIEPAGYGSVERLDGSAAGGLSVLVRHDKGDAATVLHSTDGRSWREAGRLALKAAKKERWAVTGLAPLGQSTVMVGRRNGTEAFLSVVGVGDLDLTKVAGAVLPERTITALLPAAPAPGGGQAGLVAAGSGNGDAAIWTSGDGKAWSRATGDLGGDGSQRLTGLARGAAGLIAVGRGGDDPARPLVLTSTDGTAWKRAAGFPGGDRLSTVAAAYGPAGYVVVGGGRSGAKAWHSRDLRSWKQAKGDLGDRRSLRDVTAAGTGFVAVGTQTEGSTGRPAVWTSADGRTWTAAKLPGLPPGTASGGLSRVAARGGVVIATGWATAAPAPGGAPAPDRPKAFVVGSQDGGRTWQALDLPGAGAGSEPTAVAATAKGLLITTSVGVPGRTDVQLWVSSDGRAWRRIVPHASGLDGPGEQRLNALAAIGPDLLAVGVTADHRGDAPTLWRIPAP